MAFQKVIRDILVNHEMELNGKNVIFVYADDIVILGDTENDVVKFTVKLIEYYSHRLNLDYLVINEDKTKYLVMTKHVVNETGLKVGRF